MPKVSKQSASQVQDMGPVEDRAEELDGYTVNFVTFNADVDGTPLVKGLVDDRCQCPHWGYVVKGRLICRFADGEEVYEAGDAYYMAPGHVPLADAGTETIMFSPSAELKVTEEAMARNMAQMQEA